MRVSMCGRNALAVFLLLVPAFSAVSFASTVVVGTCKTGVRFSTIQGALDAIPAGSTVNICPNTYAEQLHISQAVTLTGVAVTTTGADAIVIVPPAGGLSANTNSLASGNPIAAHIWVDNSATVNMNNIIVDSFGNGINGCAPNLIGIYYQNSSGTLNHVVTRNQFLGASEDGPLNGCQSGLGIFAQSGGGGQAHLTVTNSSVHDYQKNGITGNEGGTILTVTGSYVTGQGATGGAAENGIQIGFGANGSLTNNVVVDDVWAPDTVDDPGDAAAGILLYDTDSGANVKGNTVGNTQFGIALVQATTGAGANALVISNKVSGTRIFDGIDVCVNGATVQSNTVMNSSESAIHLDGSCDGTGGSNTVSSNTLIDTCVGILQDPGLSNSIGTNTFFTVGQTTGTSCASASASVQRGAGSRKVSRPVYRPARP